MFIAMWWSQQRSGLQLDKTNSHETRLRGKNNNNNKLEIIACAKNVIVIISIIIHFEAVLSIL